MLHCQEFDTCPTFSEVQRCKWQSSAFDAGGILPFKVRRKECSRHTIQIVVNPSSISVGSVPGDEGCRQQLRPWKGYPPLRLVVTNAPWLACAIPRRAFRV